MTGNHDFVWAQQNHFQEYLMTFGGRTALLIWIATTTSKTPRTMLHKVPSGSLGKAVPTHNCGRSGHSYHWTWNSLSENLYRYI